MQVNASFGRLLSYNKPELGWAVLGIAASAGSGVIMPIFALALSSVISLFFNPDKAYQAHHIASEHSLGPSQSGRPEHAAVCLLRDAAECL